MKFFKKILKSITDFESYKGFHLESSKKSILYLLKLCILTSLIFCTVIFILIYNHRILLDRDPIIFIVDINATEQEISEYQEKANEYEVVYMILKDKYIYKNVLIEENVSNNEAESSTKEISMSNIKQEDIRAFSITMFIITVIIFGLASFIMQLIYILILSVFGVLSKNLLKLNLGYSSIFNITVYGFTLSILLELIFNIISIFTGFTISNLDTMMMAVGYVYVLTALITIRNNMLNMQLEYSKFKMATEQGVVDLEKKDREDEKGENPKDKEDKDKKEDKEEKQKDNFNENKKLDE